MYWKTRKKSDSPGQVDFVAKQVTLKFKYLSNRQGLRKVSHPLTKSLTEMSKK